MKNYLGRLGLMRKASQPEISAALERAMQETSDLQSVVDAETVLSEKVTRTYYERTHLQYEAICASLSCLENPIAKDTHRWTERLVEFEVVDEEPLI